MACVARHSGGTLSGRASSGDASSTRASGPGIVPAAGAGPPLRRLFLPTATAAAFFDGDVLGAGCPPAFFTRLFATFFAAVFTALFATLSATFSRGFFGAFGLGSPAALEGSASFSNCSTSRSFFSSFRRFFSSFIRRLSPLLSRVFDATASSCPPSPRMILWIILSATLRDALCFSARDGAFLDGPMPSYPRRPPPRIRSRALAEPAWRRALI